MASNPNRMLRRTVLRWAHVVAGSLVATVIYSPLRENEAFVMAVQVALIPVLIVTGIWMWQRARVERLLGRSRGGRKP